MKNRLIPLRSQLIREIESVFDGILFPGPHFRSLSQAEAWDQYQQCDQSFDFQGRWQDIPLSEFKKNQWALPHLDAHGFIYYLPALMVAVLQEKDVGALLESSLINSLGGGSTASQLALLNPPQIDAVRQFLEFYDFVKNSKY